MKELFFLIFILTCAIINYFLEKRSNERLLELFTDKILDELHGDTESQDELKMKTCLSTRCTKRRSEDMLTEIQLLNIGKKAYEREEAAQKKATQSTCAPCEFHHICKDKDPTKISCEMRPKTWKDDEEEEVDPIPSLCAECKFRKDCPHADIELLNCDSYNKEEPEKEEAND